MAEVEEYSVRAESGGLTGQRPDRESGQGGAVEPLQKTADKPVEEHLKDIADCIMENIRGIHVPCASLLVAFAVKINATNEIPQEEYESLAEVLWKMHREMAEEQGTE
jgi:type III secretion system FlhB-like substrate exporter